MGDSVPSKMGENMCVLNKEPQTHNVAKVLEQYIINEDMVYQTDNVHGNVV